MRTLLLALLLIPLAADAQPRLGASLMVGIPFQGWFIGTGGREFSTDESGHWSAGGSVELRLTDVLSAAAGGIYRPIGLDSAGGYIPFSDHEEGHTWEFPILARIRLPVHVASFRPFVEAGPSIWLLRTHTESLRSGGNLGGPYTPVTVKTDTSENITGVTFGGGVEKRAGVLRVSLGARYIRLPEDHTNDLRVRHANQGVVELAVGF